MVQTGLKFKSAVDVKIDKGKVSLTELTRNDDAISTAVTQIDCVNQSILA